jgi:hypothetical protein
MAIGDFFSEISGDNANLVLQPLGSVVLMLTSFANDDVARSVQMTDGADYSEFPLPGNTSTSNMMNSKIFATNSVYYHVNAAGVGKHTSFSGVEVK